MVKHPASNLTYRAEGCSKIHAWKPWLQLNLKEQRTECSNKYLRCVIRVDYSYIKDVRKRGGGGSSKSGHLRTWGGGGSSEIGRPHLAQI